MTEFITKLVTDLVLELLKEVGSITVEQIKLLVNVEKKMVRFQEKFAKVRAMLNMAEERVLTDEAVKLWYDELKDVSYMMDNVVDSWNTAKIKSKIQEEEEKEKEADSNAPALKKVCSYFPSSSCCFADKLSLRHGIAQKIKKLNKRLDEILNDRERYGFDLNSQPKVAKPLEFTSFRDVSNIIGRDESKNDLVSKLLGMSSEEDRKPFVISLVGMGGIGKSTLALLAFNDSNVQAHFAKKMWISVPNPFESCKVAQAIIQEADPHEFSNNNTKLQALLRKISELIADKRFFLVLDDVWTIGSNIWEQFKNALMFGAPGSRILVTTRNNRVAKMMESSVTIDLGVLSTNECWSIIRKMAFPDDNQEICSDLEDHGLRLAEKCKGLPLAAKTLGSHMRGKRSEEEWKIVLESGLWELQDIGKGLLGSLLLSYYELSLEEKQCFLYCAVFPKDHSFDRFELVIHWMAQGYFNSKPNMEKAAEQSFENLAMRSFFQDFEKDDNDDRIIRCKMHDIVHEFAKSMTKDVCFTIDNDDEEKNVKRALQLSLVVKKTVPTYLSNAKNLRFLNLIWSSQTVQPKLFDNLTCLRTLHLKVESTRQFPNEVENLIHLRYLKLSCCFITELPEMICNFCNLQSLDVSECSSLKKLPLQMRKLINLRHLILSRESIVFPKGIGKLTCLKTLSDFNIGGEDDKEGCKLGELKNLNQLQGTLRIHVLRNVDEDEAKNAQLETKNLCCLELDFGFVRKREEEEQRKIMENDVLVLNALKPNLRLESLTIIYYKGTTMSLEWMMSLTKLKLLDLNKCYNLECLPPLGKLQVLESLFIRGAENVKIVGDEFLGIESKNKNKKDDIIFPKLKYLKFEYLYNWEDWFVMGGTTQEEKDNGFVPIIMPCLHSLSIMGCPKLKSLPVIRHTTLLQELKIQRSQILEQRCKPGK